MGHQKPALRTEKEARRYVPISFTEPALEEEQTDERVAADHQGCYECLVLPAAGETKHNSPDVLAGQVMAAMQVRFSPADRVAFRLQLEDMNC